MESYSEAFNNLSSTKNIEMRDNGNGGNGSTTQHNLFITLPAKQNGEKSQQCFILSDFHVTKESHDRILKGKGL